MRVVVSLADDIFLCVCVCVCVFEVTATGKHPRFTIYFLGVERMKDSFDAGIHGFHQVITVVACIVYRFSLYR